ncbi:MAG: HU family DNA-binding protein [Rickettsiella sp.]|nr:HU family DNA-binding protein [Rickettsiella sp.]
MSKDKTLTKAELISSLKEQDSSLNGNLAMQLTDAFFDEISAALENGESVKFSGLGSFRVRNKRARPGRNPKTGVTTQISSRKVVLFQASQKLKAKLKKI